MASCARTGRIRRPPCYARKRGAHKRAKLRRPEGRYARLGLQPRSSADKIRTQYRIRVLRLTKQDGTIVAEPLEVASNFITSGLGLMGRARLPENGGLLINGCNGIHMMCMRFPIDAVFIDKKGVVVKTYERLLPWIGIVPFVWRADKVAELPAGSIRRHVIKPGDQLLVA